MFDVTKKALSLHNLVFFKTKNPQSTQGKKIRIESHRKQLCGKPEMFSLGREEVDNS